MEVRTERLDAWLNVPKPAVDPATTEHLQRNVSRSEAGEYYRTMYDLIVLTLRTDMTRVVTYMSGSEGNGLAIPEIALLTEQSDRTVKRRWQTARLWLAAELGPDQAGAR